MSNVIPFAPRPNATATASSTAEDRAALAAALILLVEQVRDVTEQVAALSGPPLRIEQAAQNLLDACTSLEEALDALTEDGEWVPF